MADRTPAPAGGTAAAVAVAMAAGLVAMAARVSTEQLPDADEVVARVEALRATATRLADEDAAAYGRVLAARRARAGVREALREAAEVVLLVAETGSEVAELAARLAREAKPALRGDSATAQLLAQAATRAAARMALVDLEAADPDPNDATDRDLQARIRRVVNP